MALGFPVCVEVNSEGEAIPVCFLVSLSPGFLIKKEKAHANCLNQTQNKLRSLSPIGNEGSFRFVTKPGQKVF